MNELPEIVLKRRAAALLEIRFAALARAGKPITGAYVNRIPPLRVVWGHAEKPAAAYIGKPLH